MLPINKNTFTLIISSLMIILGQSIATAQTAQPRWWFGLSGAANLNFYSGTTQRLNNSLIVPTAFHKGNGVRPYGSLLMEYRPAGMLGFMLNVGYDGRGGKFDSVMAPCDCPATLKTNLDYLTVEPSLRLGVPSTNLYFFAGPRVAFAMQKEFKYTQLKQPDTNEDFSEINSTIFSGQIGMGYDLPISSPNSKTKASLSPFVSYHPYFGQDARNIESWSVSTVRAGIALKFGRAGKVKEAEVPVAVIPAREVTFTVRAPKTVPAKRLVSETLPLRNSVFFNEGSAAIPTRYVLLTNNQASAFREASLQNEQTPSMNGRSARQLNVYHNILNILGDRMRANPGAVIALSGASANGPQEGKLFAEAIKQYMVSVFGINGSRISTVGRTKPLIPSEQPGGTKELVLLREGDRRVDISSASPELLMEVGGGMMKPVQILATQIDPLDSHVIFNVDGANAVLKSWTLDLTDERGTVKHYGPFTRDRESMTGTSILGNNKSGNYKVVMLGESKNGLPVRKETTVALVRQDESTEKGYRYSILFDFDKSNSIASYDKFLSDVVSPLITSGSTVIVHGHTDIIGEEDYNHKLSHSRATETQKIIQTALTRAGKSNVKFETLGFGEDSDRTPFENKLPEERFYNRTVIIDIIPGK
ncbi:outer membrane beta-barrel protein [Paradesertivirga mongoliensis]|uniref:Outer membrane beta-barrel protein n=1 Tax=Paradesertivirga mongoliensis TaxID=2100740 RepID=A0ABW4ZJX8_9SPHI|nr:OmpA family protein [Pedobacter mongoliensis]